MFTLDEFQGKPDGTWGAQDRMVFLTGCYETPPVQITAPVQFDALGDFCDLLTITGGSA